LTGVIQRDVVDGNRFDMELCLRKFAEHYAEMFSERDAELYRHADAWRADVACGDQAEFSPALGR